MVIYNVVCCEEVEAKGSTIAVRQGNTDTREKYIKGTGKLIKRSMKLSTLLIISAIVAAFGSLQVEGFGTPYKPKPRTDIPRCDSPAHTRKPGSRCYLPRYDVHGDFNQFDEDDDEFVGNAWTNGWLRHYCAGGPTPGKMAEWFRYCKMAAGADQMEEDEMGGRRLRGVSRRRLPYRSSGSRHPKAKCTKHFRHGPRKGKCAHWVFPKYKTWDVMDDDESVGGWHETERMKKILNQRGPGWDEMGDDEDVGNAWTNGWVRHYCAGGPTPGKMAEWFRYCKMAAGAR